MIVYKGPSMLDGTEIVVIATGLDRKSKNEKTGDVVQTWILRADVDPVQASQAKLDGSVCGTCPHRRSLGGSCYVTLHQAPLSTWRAFQRGSHGDTVRPDHLARLFAGRQIRLGSYGDPAAVPLWVWEEMTAKAAGWMGYTHQWMRPRVGAKGLGRFCMASCDSERDRLVAQSKGWRTFRVRMVNAPVMPGEFNCPATPEGGNTKDCASCGACSGVGKVSSKAASPTLYVHGGLSKRFEAIAARA